jgi:hypothetical protein
MIYHHSTATITEWNQKEQRRFQCQNEGKWNHIKPFYDIDCTNPFLVEFMKGIGDATKDDICHSFNPLYTRITTDFRSFKTFQLTDFNELLKACPRCHHLQVIDGKLYDVPRSTSTDYQTRSKSVKTLFKYVIDTFNDIPNMEFLIHAGDSVDMTRNVTHPLKCPVFGFARKKNDILNSAYTDGVVSIPCFSFWNWPEAEITRWNEKIISIKQAGDKKTFDKKESKLFWRGAQTGQRDKFVSITEKYRQKMDVSFMNWERSEFQALPIHKEYRTLEQHCDYKYLLHLEGKTYSGRLKYLLLCGSPVIFAKIAGWEEFWYHLLTHQENIIILDSVDEVLLLNLTNYLLENSERASCIGINGRNLVLKYLNEQAIICYMRNVFLTYGKLVDYQVTKRDQVTVI